MGKASTSSRCLRAPDEDGDDVNLKTCFRCGIDISLCKNNVRNVWKIKFVRTRFFREKPSGCVFLCYNYLLHKYNLRAWYYEIYQISNTIKIRCPTKTHISNFHNIPCHNYLNQNNVHAKKPHRQTTCKQLRDSSNVRHLWRRWVRHVSMSSMDSTH